ncbi:pirin family protein, partial [bacterium]|nr:pirin family protein [bacterium]
MLNIRKSSERGYADHGWLKSYHTFSFASYYDPRQIHFRQLRVINEDFIAPSSGFPAHGHDNMEIITYVVSGAVEHKDSMGNSLIIPAGEVQAMSAGSGITHSEFNPSDSEPLHLLQIWVFPQTDHVQPRYRQQAFSRESKLNQLRRIVSPDGSDSSLAIHQDMTLYASILESGYQIDFPIAPKRHVWIQLISG